MTRQNLRQITSPHWILAPWKAPRQQRFKRRPDTMVTAAIRERVDCPAVITKRPGGKTSRWPQLCYSTILLPDFQFRNPIPYICSCVKEYFMSCNILASTCNFFDNRNSYDSSYVQPWAFRRGTIATLDWLDIIRDVICRVKFSLIIERSVNHHLNGASAKNSKSRSGRRRHMTYRKGG